MFTHKIIVVVYYFLYLINVCFSQMNVDYCCELGRRNSQSSRLCYDYSDLNLHSPTDSCKYAFTICCNEHKKNAECERGKIYAFQQESCLDSTRTGTDSCDAYVDCCNCCQLGIQTSKSGDQCDIHPKLSTQCNQIFVDCCISTKSSAELRTAPKNDAKKSEDAEKYGDCSNTHTCPTGQMCQNTINGPTCVCIIGYHLDSRTGTCVDIDECKQTNTCPLGSTCENTIGSFTCTRSCGIGFVFDSTVEQCRDINECAMNIHKCAKGMRCENIPGSYRCIREIPCGTGYSVDSFTQDCIDIDECALGIHGCTKGYICQNLIGSYKCKPKQCDLGFIFNFNTGDCVAIRCKVGYMIHNQTGECVDMNECDLIENACRLSEKCENTQGSYRCIVLSSCERGYELIIERNECVDIDECARRKHTCPSNTSCINTIGGFTCKCPVGYELDITGTRCDDIDECSHGLACPRNSKCVNTVGSYDCRCDKGFNISREGLTIFCRDADECKIPDICQHKCVNTYGSYQCICNEGFRLASDRKTCTDIDECQLHKSICQGECTNTIGSFECVCGKGFTLDPHYKRSCADIDECALGTHNCRHTERCLNTRGGFKCLTIQCPSGYFLAGGAESTRCDRANTICRSEDTECYRKPMKIIHHYITFSYKVSVPIKLLTPPTIMQTRFGFQSIRYDLKFIHTYNTTADHKLLTKDDFNIRYTGTTTIELYLHRSPVQQQEVKLELHVDVYSNRQYVTSVLHKIFLYITE